MNILKARGIIPSDISLPAPCNPLTVSRLNSLLPVYKAVPNRRENN